VTAYNEIIRSINVELRDPSGLTVLKDLNNIIVQRQFIDTGESATKGRPLFNSGGRLFPLWFKLSSTTERPHIFIDGQPAVELDYQVSAINLIYKALTGVSCIGDPYTLSVGQVY
jgi:hypothetical protein